MRCDRSGKIDPGFTACRCIEALTDICKACSPDDCPGCEDCRCPNCEGRNRVGIIGEKGFPLGRMINCPTCDGTGRRVKDE